MARGNRRSAGGLAIGWLAGASQWSCAMIRGGPIWGRSCAQLLLTYRGAMSLTSEALLFMASRAQLVAEVIRPALAQGQVVLADRFLLANVVYQGHAGGLDPAQLWNVGLFCTGGLEPDLTFRPGPAARNRVCPPQAWRGPRGEPRPGLLRGCPAGFVQEARRRPDCFRVIDGTLAPEQVEVQLQREVQALLSKEVKGGS